MKTNYENWVPEESINGVKYISWLGIFLFVGISAYIFYRNSIGQVYLPWLSIIAVVFLLIGVICFVLYKKFRYMREVFDYKDENALSWKIIKYTADAIDLDNDAKVLDVGCGSGALCIDIAKKNPKAKVVGMDKWGRSYKEFSELLCQKNAEAEGVENIEFKQGNATKLDFEDESFDAVVSNYVYHNIPGDRQKYLLETFRVLKKGGQFAIHDIFIPVKYGNIEKFRQKLLDMGYESVEFVDTTSGYPMTKEEASSTMLTGSKLLVGKK